MSCIALQFEIGPKLKFMSAIIDLIAIKRSVSNNKELNDLCKITIAMIGLMSIGK